MERIMKWAVALIATGLLSGCGGNSGWQDLIGEVATGDPLTVLGEYGGYWYASLPADIENDLLRIGKVRP